MVTEEMALNAVVVVTGIPSDVLVENPGYEGRFVFVSNLSKKTYYVESVQKVNSITPEEREDMEIFGEHDGLCVYEVHPWWDKLV
ncbi:hypothetical protein [Paenibacillus sp. IHBB 10380]|uniref:hypothetical protein n=1 Tax=Paenibacillus sp. IHBB 10380 TaxID=1566358 RepID=UPI0005CFA6B4|nr:hypothetical protein [Paenibacillus sp. IHBB 10380]AJS57282.1 hypothetical protein UB51_00825 [Paenibacillus sp. IHBB 10380]